MAGSLAYIAIVRTLARLNRGYKRVTNLNCGGLFQRFPFVNTFLMNFLLTHEMILR